MTAQQSHFLLLQVRNVDDPMKDQERWAFAETIGCDVDALATHDLLAGVPRDDQLASARVILLGGSGDYSVSQGGPWLAGALRTMEMVHDLARPTFASCMGFHLMTAALGGRVERVPEQAELGAIELTLTEAGRLDPVFGSGEGRFTVLAGHQDVAVTLPPDVELLASSSLVRHQAYKVRGKPIYCAQFHPELNRERFLERVRVYPEYVEKIAKMPYEEFESRVVDTPEAADLLRRFVARV